MNILRSIILLTTLIPIAFSNNFTTVTISAAGDTTLGGDSRWNGYHAFMREFREHGHDFFMRNVREIFEEDDLTILNLEGALTDRLEPHMDKTFVFRGQTDFSRILSYGSVEVVSLANNHSGDFFEEGTRDTKVSLTSEGILYFGFEDRLVTNVNGVYVGLFGYSIWNDSDWNRGRISRAIEHLQMAGADIIIAYFHWGVERDNHPQEYQRSIGRFTIDSGAHLVLGAHPHVLQGIEEHNGRYIVYSLGNFSFGGNSNPPDQDTMIFRQTFIVNNHSGEIAHSYITIIPATISSVRGRNNFQPTPAYGEEAERILRRIEEFSEGLR